MEVIVAMRHVFPEHAGQFSKRTGEKVFRTEESVGNDKRGGGECVKLGDSRRVLVKMPGSRLKSGSSSHQAHPAHPALQAKEVNNGDNKLVETVENVGVKDEEEGSEEGVKRPQADGVNLQWGQKKRTRHNKADAKASVEKSSGDKNPIVRPDRRVVRAEKVGPGQGKAAAVAPCSQSPLKSTNGGSRSQRCGGEWDDSHSKEYRCKWCS